MKGWKHRLLPGAIMAALCLLLVPTALAAGIPSGYDCPEQKLVALTFDDGPGIYSDDIIDILKEHNAKATFFLNGYRLDHFADQVKRMVAEGHQIGNHTYNHPDLNECSDEVIWQEVISTSQALTAITGLPGTGDNGFYLRPPFNNVDKHVAELVGLPVIWCSLDVDDWSYQCQQAEALADNTGSAVTDGDIVIMHETHKPTLWALSRLLEALEAKGYTAVTVQELFWRRGIDPQQGNIYYNASAADTGVNRCARELWFDETRLYTHWAWKSIAYVWERDWMTGNTYGEFMPEYPLTRGMFVTILGRMSGVEAGEIPSGFSDIPATHWSAPYAAWAGKSGIMVGMGDGSFNVNGPITRQELATALARYLQLALPEGSEPTGAVPFYGDRGTIADWAQDAVTYCGEMGLLIGYDDGQFHPTDTTTRAMGAMVLQRLDGYL